MKLQIIIKFMVLSLLATTLSSCLYKMPNESTVSVIPNTNNKRMIGAPEDDASKLSQIAY